MFNKPIIDITKGISSLYISDKKRKHSEIVKLNKNNENNNISNKFKDLKDKFKDLESLYDEIEDELQDVHFMNLSDIKTYKKKKETKNRKYTSTNNYKNFNYYYNNLNDYYYNLYKKITNKKQKTSDNDNNESEENKIKDKRALYSIDKKISLNFSDKKLNEIKLGSISNENIDTEDKVVSIDDNEISKEDFNNSNNSNNNNNNNDNEMSNNDYNNGNHNNDNNNNINNNNDNNNINNNNVNSNNPINENRSPRSKKYLRPINNKKYHNILKNNFIPSGIRIPKTFNNTNNNIIKGESNKEDNKSNIYKNINKNENKNIKEKPFIKRHKSLLTPLQHLSLNNVIAKRSSSSFFNNLSRSSLVSSNSDTIKNNDSKKGKRTKRTRDFTPLFNISQSSEVLENLSKSQFLEDLNDYVEKVNEENNNVNVYSTCSKLNTIPYNPFQPNEYLNLMNENKSKTNYLKLYSSRSIRTSSSDFLLDSSSESIKDKLDYIRWNKNMNINNNYYQINNEYSDEESDPFENISDLSVSSVEKELHKSINNINENKSKKHGSHHKSYSKEEKRNKRTRNSSNLSLNSNATSISTITTETTTTTTSNITIENENYQDDITYGELLNNPMKKHEIYQMEKSHNQFMKSWLDFENRIYSNLNSFIKNDFIDLYDYLCKKSNTINSGDNNKANEIPLP